MRHLAFALLTVTCQAAPGPAGDVIPPQPVDGKIRWVYDYAEGKRLAKEAGKPLFVVLRCER